MKKQEFIKYTKETWQPYYEEELSDLDAVEITNNMVDFMNLLIKWDKEDREAEQSSSKQSGQIVGNSKNKEIEK